MASTEANGAKLAKCSKLEKKIRSVVIKWDRSGDLKHRYFSPLLMRGTTDVFMATGKETFKKIYH